MFESKRVYSDDRLVHYKDSKVPPEVTQKEIEALLTNYGMTGIHWQNGTLLFETTYKGHPIPIKKTIPLIYSRKTEQVDWTVTMRTLFHSLKGALEIAYVSGITLTEAFLPDVLGQNGLTVKESILPMLEKR
jgi:hypothetical protein